MLLFTSETLIPRVLWAQRSDCLFVTFEVFEVKEERVECTAEKISFEGIRSGDGAKFAVELELYANVDASSVKTVVGHREVSLTVKKAESGPYWPRLLKSSQKMHYIHTDFGKWKDEDEEDEEEGYADQGFGGFDPSALMGGVGNNFDFSQFGSGSGFEEDESYEEDESFEAEEANEEGNEDEVKISGLTKDNAQFN